MQQTIQISAHAHNDLFDITREVEAIVKESGVQSGLVNVYTQGEIVDKIIEFKFIASLLCLPNTATVDGHLNPGDSKNNATMIC